MDTSMHKNICDWICESSPSSEPDDNELDTGFCGQLNCGLKLEESFEFTSNNHLVHNSSTQPRCEEMNLSLNSNYNCRPKLEPQHSDFEFHPTQVQNNSSDAQMDVYRDLILRHLIQDIATTCSKLSLPTDPNLWTVENTMSWIREMCEQFNIRTPVKLNIDGKKLMEITQDEFCTYIPEGGDTLHAQFQLWKTAFETHNANQQKQQLIRQPNVTSVSLAYKTSWESNSADSETAVSANNPIYVTGTVSSSPVMPTEHSQPGYYSDFTHQQTHHQQPINYQLSMVSQQPAHNHYNQEHKSSFGDTTNYYTDYTNLHVLGSPSESDISSSSSMIDEDPMDVRFTSFEQQNRLAYESNVPSMPYIDMGYDSNLMIGTQNSIGLGQQHSNGVFNYGVSKLNAYSSVNSTSFTKSNSGSIHLWHFIRELLDQPKEYGSCVRWVDRNEGTFKIESSHNLARFWGQRKNRSQMNYDKLSRSLRQYYKKGIIQKPEKKQRLVYKFLPPYHH